jgi:hypothetical protein
MHSKPSSRPRHARPPTPPHNSYKIHDNYLRKSRPPHDHHLRNSPLGRHLQLVQFTDELNQAKTLSLGPLRCIVFVRVGLDFAGCFCCLLDSGAFGYSRGGVLRGPATLEVLKTVQEVLSEKLTASDGLSLRVSDTVVLVEIGTDLLHHLPAKSRIHFQPRSLANCLKNQPDDMDERPSVLPHSMI